MEWDRAPATAGRSRTTSHGTRSFHGEAGPRRAPSPRPPARHAGRLLPRRRASWPPSPPRPLPLLRALLALLLGLLAALAPAQQGPGGGGPGGGLALESVTGGAPDGGSVPTPYHDDGRGYGGEDLAGLYADCHGEITYTYKWDEAYGPAPRQAVVHLRSDASLDGESGDVCDDGLGDPMVVGGHPGEYLASSQGERYRIMDLQGDTLVVRIHPYSQSSYLASVWVNVDAAPILVTLGGPRVADAGGAYECMVGRSVTGTLSAGGYPVEPSSYHWSIGGSTFKDYFADNSRGAPTLLASSDLQQASPHWFWKIGENATVSCTGTVDLPDGTSPSVSAQTACDVTTPDSHFPANALSDHWTMTGAGGRTAVTWDPTITTGDDAGFCIKFFGSAKTPDRFWAWDGGPGEFCCVQLAYIGTSPSLAQSSCSTIRITPGSSTTTSPMNSTTVRTDGRQTS